MRDDDKTLQPLSPEIAALHQRVTDLEQQLQRSQTQLQAAIAEQQRLAASLQETQIKNRALLQAIPDLIMRLDRTGVYLDFIEAKHIDLLIGNVADRLGKRVSEVLPNAIAQQYLQAVALAIDTGEIQVFEYQLAINGSSKHYEARVVSGGVEEAVLVVRDITQRKQAEEALRLEREKSERLLLNILPQPIAELLKQQSGSIATQFEAATILFADIVDFTRLSAELSATELVGLLNEIFSTFDALADQYDLEKIKTIGDAYMVVGGIPTHREDHAEAIAEMALAMQRAIKAFTWPDGKSFQVRIGINTGPVVAGVIGIKKFIYDLWGDAVNVASRMESQGLAGGIQVTATTYQHLCDKYVFTVRGTIEVKGKGPMMTYLLTDRRS